MKIGAALKPLIQKHGWDVIRPAWQKALSECDPRWFTAALFAEKLSLYLPKRAPKLRIPQSEEQALAWVYSQGYELELGARGISALELWKEKHS